MHRPKVPVPNKARYPNKAHLNYFVLPNEKAMRCHHQIKMFTKSDVMDAGHENNSVGSDGRSENTFSTPFFWKYLAPDLIFER